MKKLFVCVWIVSSLILSLYGAVTWKEFTSEDIAGAYGMLAWKAPQLLGVRRTLLYTPEEIESKEPIALIVVHGTFAAESKEYQNEAQYFFPGVKVYAQKLADEYKAPVRLVFYRWSGYDGHNYRYEAGKHLAQVIDEHHGHRIITIAHSHGGNVVNYASNHIKGKIDLMIHFGTPVIAGDQSYRPSNFTMLCNFYSSSDLIQLLGATDAHKAWRGAMKMWYTPLTTFRNYCLENVGSEAGRVINVSTQINGYDADHSDIKNIVSEMPAVIRNFTEHYQLHNDFHLNVDLRHNNAKYKILCALKNPKKDTEDAIIEQEMRRSEEQKALYRKLYSKEMGSVLPRLRYLSSLAFNTLLLVPRIRSLCERYKFYKFAPFMAVLD